MGRNVSINLVSVMLLFTIAFTSVQASEHIYDTLYAGLRCSDYGFGGPPGTTWLGNACRSMVSRFIVQRPKVIPCVIWIVDTWSSSETREYLDYFEDNGIAVLLQVEPGNENVNNLAREYLDRYADDYECIIGFGIDVEWYTETPDYLGKKVTDAEARLWRNTVKGYNSDYILMLKHFFPAWMPPTEREGIMFLDDSQQFPNFDLFINETDPTTRWNVGYRVWAEKVYPYMSGMQYGYDDAAGGPSDKLWWSKLDDPPREIGDSCLSAGPNTNFLFWVDFTADDREINWDIVTSTKPAAAPKVSPMEIAVQNGTMIIHHPSFENSEDIKLLLFDLNGKMVLSNKYKDVSEIALNVDHYLSKGMYLMRVIADDLILSRKITVH